jgi:hypothetical protein
MDMRQRIKNLIAIAEQEAERHKNPESLEEYYWQGYYVGQLFAFNEILANL